MKKISILIPIYNAELYVNRCLSSIFSQQMEDIEVIIVNDGSTDGTEDKISKFGSKIKYFKKQNEGVGAARNRLIDLAEGEYIWFVDADDYLYEHSVEKVINILRSDSTIDMLTILHNDIQKSDFFEGSGENYILKRLFNGYLWSKVIKRSVLEDNGIRFIPNMYSQEDWLFLMKVYPHLKHIKETGIRAYCYCDDNVNSVMRKPTRENIHRNVENSLRTICYFKQFIQEYQGQAIYKPYHSWLNYSMSGFLFSLLPLDYSRKELKEMLQVFKGYHVYPVGKSDNHKADLFLQFANWEWLFLLMVRLWKKVEI